MHHTYLVVSVAIANVRCDILCLVNILSDPKSSL